MRKLFLVLCGALAVTTLFVAAPCSASLQDEAVGSVVAVRGEVKASGPSQGERVLGMKSEVFQSDTIRTGAGGRLQLLFKDNTIVSLGADTVMEIANFAWNADKNSGSMKTRVEEGTFRVLGGLITKNSPQNFSTETPAATIGIRGSMYAGSYRNNHLRVAFLGGRGIYVANPYGQVEIDKPGFGTSVTPGSAPTPPEKMDGLDALGLLEDNGGDGTGAGDDQDGLSAENAELLDTGTGGVTDTTTIDVAMDTGADIEQSASEDNEIDEIVDNLPDPPVVENLPPIADDDFVATAEDSTLNIDVSVNDQDADGVLTSWSVTIAPAYGFLTNNDDGTFTYTPNPNYAGDDTFTYQVTDDQGDTDTAVVNIVVSPVNDPPVAVNDTVITPENSLAIINVTGNDMDIEGAINEWLITVQPGHGSLVNNEDGTFSYTPEPDYVGEDSFTYQITDDGGATSQAVVFITSINVPVVVMSGKHMRSFTPLSGGPSDSVGLDLTAASKDGLITPTIPGGRSTDPFTIAQYDPDQPYSSVLSYEEVATFTTSTRGSFETTRTIIYDNAGEFFITINDDSLVTLNDGDYSTMALSFAGVPTTLTEMPTTGLDEYSGSLLATPVETETADSSDFNSDVKMSVNWANGKVFGIIPDDSDYGPKYFYGDISDTSTSTLHFAGAVSSADPEDFIPQILSENESLGQFYGSDYQGFGLTAYGINLSTYNLTEQGHWLAAGGFMRLPGTVSQPTGTTTLEGSIVGQFLNLNAQTFNYGWSFNHYLSFNLNFDTGKIEDGSFYVFPLGGAGQSAVIDQQKFIAEIGPAISGTQTAGDGSFMVTAEEQFSNDVTWGYWNMVYSDTDYSADPHYTYAPNTYWIAGEKAPLSLLQNLRSTNLGGDYVGPAYGIKGAFTSEPIPINGLASIHFSFGDGYMDGSFDFGTDVLYFSGPAFTDASMQTEWNPLLTGGDFFAPSVQGSNSSYIEGYFYGPGAGSIGGTFSIDMSDDTYLGIFGGNLDGDFYSETSGTTTLMTGRSQNFLRKENFEVGCDGADGCAELVSYSQQGLTATSIGNEVSPVKGINGAMDPFSMDDIYPAAPYDVIDASAPYSGWYWNLVNDPSYFYRNGQKIETTRDIAWDSKGEFFVYEQNYPGDLVDIGGTNYQFQSLNFGGVPTAAGSLPTTGIDVYDGEILGDSLDDWGLDYDESLGPNYMPETSMSVNWANQKVLGYIVDNESSDYPDHLYFYGDLSDGPSGIKLVTGEAWSWAYDDPATDVWTSVGDTSFWQFYGSEYQGFGVQLDGDEYLVSGNMTTPESQWQATGGLFLEAGATETSPTGIKRINGYFIGQADLITDPGGYFLFNNSSSNAFHLDLDAGAGSVTGSGEMYLESVNFDIGGADNSAYIDDQRFIAEFVPGTYGNATVKPEGSFLVTAEPELQFSDYATWGYWNVTVVGPTAVNTADGVQDLHVHSPGSFWVAGERTGAAIEDLIDTVATGSYTGPAYGVVRNAYDGYEGISPLTNGTTELSFTFGADPTITGAIDFTEVNLPISGALNLANLTGDFYSLNAITGSTLSEIRGTFFGPNAEATGGTFQSYTPDSRYSGIFMGERYE